MTAMGPMAEPDLAGQLGGIASRLIDIAGCVASEAEAATMIVRGMTDHANRVASLAAGLETAAALIEEAVRQQANALMLARAALTTNKPVIDALEQSISGVASINATIAGIARESRVLSLNARIEAARAGPESGAFGVVAAEMSTLAMRTKDATDEIANRSSAIVHDVSAASEMVTSHGVLVLEQDELLTASLAHAIEQRQTAQDLAIITTETAATVDQAAAAIGRVGANAVAVKVLARQLTRLNK